MLRPGFSLMALICGAGLMLAGDTGGGSGGGGTTEPPVVEEEETAPEFTPAQLAWMEKQDKIKADQAKETDAQTAARLKQEAKDELTKEQKAKDRKAAQDKAKEEGNQAEILRLVNEEKETERLEKEQAKAELQAERDLNVKLALVTKYKLPAGYEKRIIGKNAAEWDTDAQELAKALPVPTTRPKMEGGSQETSTKEAQTKSATRNATNLVASF